MGYSHYWHRPPAIADDVFQRIRTDFERLILRLEELGVPIAGGDGENEPEINDSNIRFNGVRYCEHPENEDIVIPYPSEHARGVGSSETAILGPWYNVGVELKHRCCGSRCAHEPFCFPKRAPENSEISIEPETAGLVDGWTKTAFKPYDIAVTSALLIAKRYLRDQLVVESNGADPQWADARELCQKHLGYGDWFGIIEDPRIELWPGPNGSKVEREVRVRLLIEMDPARFR